MFSVPRISHSAYLYKQVFIPGTYIFSCNVQIEDLFGKWQSTLTLCQSWLYPPVRDLEFGLRPPGLHMHEDRTDDLGTYVIPFANNTSIKTELIDIPVLSILEDWTDTNKNLYFYTWRQHRPGFLFTLYSTVLTFDVFPAGWSLTPHLAKHW